MEKEKIEDQALSLEKQESKSGPINIELKRGIIPYNYNELLQFAALYKQSELAPKSFMSVQQIAIAIGMCMELGRPILTGLQDMAVINGRVSIYGDAALAIVRSSGLLEDIEEREEGEPYKDSWKFTCQIKRKGSQKARIGVWTWEDAKRAGFDDPKMRNGEKDIYSPWRRFTRRMMQFKARNFPLRDEFADILKGITLVEDAQDIIDVNPEIPSLKIARKEQETAPADKDVYAMNEMPEEEKKTEAETQSGETEQPGPVDEIIEQFSNLKAKGLQEWADKNQKMLPLMDAKVQEAFKQKWLRVLKVEYPSLPEQPSIKPAEPKKEGEEETTAFQKFMSKAVATLGYKYVNNKYFQGRQSDEISPAERTKITKDLRVEMDLATNNQEGIKTEQRITLFNKMKEAGLEDEQCVTFYEEFMGDSKTSERASMFIGGFQDYLDTWLDRQREPGE